jgi:hypothetical protein
MANTAAPTTTKSRRITTTTTATNTIAPAAVVVEREETKDLELQLEKKITIATDGIQQQYFTNQLRHLNKQELSNATIGERQNIETICDYIIAMVTEINPSIMYRAHQLQVLCYLSEFYHNQKLFSKMTRVDVVGYVITTYTTHQFAN